jgi:hypothetical protein
MSRHTPISDASAVNTLLNSGRTSPRDAMIDKYEFERRRQEIESFAKSEGAYYELKARLFGNATSLGLCRSGDGYSGGSFRRHIKKCAGYSNDAAISSGRTLPTA